jgi:hypothetical protein
MLKTAERAFKKEKGLVLLIQYFRMSKKKDKKDKKNNSLVSKAKKTYWGHQERQGHLSSLW